MSPKREAKFRGFSRISVKAGLCGNRMKRPKLLLMGLRRSGKSSIQKVVFHKMSPNETLFLESTTSVQKDEVHHSHFLSFDIIDFPGQLEYFDPAFSNDTVTIFTGIGALIFVIDAQDDYIDALSKLLVTISRAYKINPHINFEVFIHKVDGLSDDHKIETQRDIHQRMMDELMDAGLDHVQLNFYLTSIYDHSVFEALSKVIQKLIPQLATLENLLNMLCFNSGIEKAFLFDAMSKIYIATDSSPVDMQTYELCSDMIDVIIDISCIYGMPPKQLLARDEQRSAPDDSTSPIELKQISIANGGGGEKRPEQNGYSYIKLNNGVHLYFREVSQHLVLVCLFRGDGSALAEKRGLVEYNFNCFRESLQKVFAIEPSIYH